MNAAPNGRSPMGLKQVMLLWLLSHLVSAATWAEPLPDELRTALKGFQAEGTRGWAFTQTTRGEGQSMVERFDPRMSEYKRWELQQKNGRAPTESESKTYNEVQTRHSRGETAPNVKDQIDDSTAEKTEDDGTRVRWKFRLKTTDKDDRSAAHMTATFTLHRPTGTIEQVDLASFEPFSPVLGVKIDEARTQIQYTLPDGERPTLLRSITVRLRGRAWWLKSLDQDLTVEYSNFEFAKRR